MVPSRRVGLILLLYACFGAPMVFAYEKEVDWMWNDTKAKTRGGSQCKNFVVKAGPPKILRGKVSGRTCLETAIKSYRHGDHEEAFGWILAGQCHDRTARETLVRNAPKALEYLIDTYGKHVPSH